MGKKYLITPHKLEWKEEPKSEIYETKVKEETATEKEGKKKDCWSIQIQCAYSSL